jgi:hypothetical protein
MCLRAVRESARRKSHNLQRVPLNKTAMLSHDGFVLLFTVQAAYRLPAAIP